MSESKPGSQHQSKEDVSPRPVAPDARGKETTESATDAGPAHEARSRQAPASGALTGRGHVEAAVSPEPKAPVPAGPGKPATAPITTDSNGEQTASAAAADSGVLHAVDKRMHALAGPGPADTPTPPEPPGREAHAGTGRETPGHVTARETAVEPAKAYGRRKRTRQAEAAYAKSTGAQRPPNLIEIPHTASSLYVAMITPELAPVAKVGGLGDVVFGLSRELERNGHGVEIILPKYNCMRYDQIWGLHGTYDDLSVPWFGGSVHCSVVKGWVHGRVCFFIDAHSKDAFFNRGCIYGCQDDLMRFAFFCKAALEFMLKTNRRPDIIHCHDWPTGLTPVLLYEMYAAAGMGHCRVCYTIHNFRHQGTAGHHLLQAVGLNRPEYFFRPDKMRDNHNHRVLNMMKAGIVYSNFVTTVSPHYAWDARFGGQGFGMDPSLNEHHAKFGGIVNGVDHEYWDPKTDPHIPYHYSADAAGEKCRNKRLLRQRFWLADNDRPIVAFVGRLDPQKGLDLVRHAIHYCIGHHAQFVLLGSSPDGRINGAFWDLKRRLNDNPDCHLEIAFNEELSHLVYAGSDMMLVPSLYEPCGLTQLIALRYGSVPVVRAAGGLIDTVIDKDYSDKPAHERNGYVFNDANTQAVEWVLDRAISCYRMFPEDFRKLMLNGMRQDTSWRAPAQHYIDIYRMIKDRSQDES